MSVLVNPESENASRMNESHLLMMDMLSGKKTTPEIVEFLTNYPESAVSPTELIDFLSAIKQTAEITIDATKYPKPVVDIAGTGGDQLQTVNISTLAALVAAASDEVIVYKYGNRSASGVCGSMDVLEAVGVAIDTLPKNTDDLENNFIPLFARLVYPGARHVAEARKVLGKPSVFNLLFPLARPIKGPFSFVMGFAQPEKMSLAAQIISLQPISALLVHGTDGSDEVSVTGEGKTKYHLIRNGQIVQGTLDVQKLLGINPIKLSLLQIEDKAEATDLFLKTLDPSYTNQRIEAIRLSVAVNAAAVLTIAKLTDLGSFEEEFVAHFSFAQQTLFQGRAHQLLSKLKTEK